MPEAERAPLAQGKDERTVSVRSGSSSQPNGLPVSDRPEATIRTRERFSPIGNPKTPTANAAGVFNGTKNPAPS